MKAEINLSAFFVDNNDFVKAGDTAEIEIRNVSDGSLATLWQDRDGITSQSNPFDADGSGSFQVFADGGTYEITATSSDATQTKTIDYYTAFVDGFSSVGTDEIDDNAVTLAKLADGTANRLLGYDDSGDPAEISVSGATLSGTALSIALQAQNVRNLTIQNNSTDADHDIDFLRTDANVPAVVVVRDASNNQAVLSITPSTITKQIDATWASGNNEGGLADALTVANNTIYYCFLLTDGTDVDYGFDTAVDASNLLADTAVVAAGLNQYVKIGSLLTDGSANIIAGTWREIEGGALQFVFGTSVTEITANTPGDVSRTAQTVSAPAESYPLFEVSTATATNGRELQVYMYDNDADVEFYVHANASTGGSFSVDNIGFIKTDASREVDYRLVDTGTFNGDWTWKTTGWKELR